MNAFGIYEIGKNQQGYLFLNFLGFDECFWILPAPTFA